LQGKFAIFGMFAAKQHPEGGSLAAFPGENP
jgi:hypothetical protein